MYCSSRLIAKIVLQKQNLNQIYKNLSLNYFRITHTLIQVINHSINN
ncbi:hypothetical protein VCRA2120O333_190061 [Vibrio crassostreae]|nr:hypothetical protein VCRA2113O322_110098 [Vibrio crassostreae]CAK1722513.1 hypothetical protein VCRA2113O326_110110 [Vibrio crassostreae]CAK1773665.1 hypothetical protein VCRA2111O320_150052 [Vibrio crassostreae]CAK2251476.1 hypothetical protein VCRA2113O324_80195 [Vibrio crassostreae]CAK2402517.1 hypothetical protein VCRA2114E327_120063 [Vibrio crassostreae]